MEANFLNFYHPTQNLDPIGSAVLALIGKNRQTNRQAKYIYK